MPILNHITLRSLQLIHKLNSHSNRCSDFVPAHIILFPLEHRHLGLSIDKERFLPSLAASFLSYPKVSTTYSVMSSPLPLILCGKFPGHVAAVREALKPKYELIEVCSSVDAFAKKLPNPSARPVLILMGGGFTFAEFEAAYGVPGASSIPWLRPISTKPGNEHMRPPQPPSAEEVAAGARKGIDERIDAILAGEGKGEVWYY